ncbi:MAG: MBL fold metallo-hydrolase [Chlamydiia bacterium]|nr:MBL fold metallo-hydrolase [Chlamydiia bacterium]
MTVYTFPSGPIETNTYIYALPDKTCYIIDAAPMSYGAVKRKIDEMGLKPVMLLLTHSHWDHIADVPHYKDAFPDLPVAVHPLDAPNLKTPGADGLPVYFTYDPMGHDIELKEGKKIGPFDVIETPGHTPGGVVFYDPKEGVAFSGDTLFKGTFGNVSFPQSSRDLMWKSLKKLAKLPGQTKVFPGHGEPTTIEKEWWLSRPDDLVE